MQKKEQQRDFDESISKIECAIDVLNLYLEVNDGGAIYLVRDTLEQVIAQLDALQMQNM